MVGAAERSDVEGIWETLESRFYRPEDELYVDEISADGWDDVASYRGQNANVSARSSVACGVWVYGLFEQTVWGGGGGGWDVY